MNVNLLTYNIRGDLWTREASQSLAELIRERDIDILFLQEVVITHKRDSEDQKDSKETKRDIIKEIEEALDGEYKGMSYLPAQTSARSVGNAFLFKKNKLKAVGQEFKKAFPKISQRTLLEEWGEKFMLPMRRIIMSEKFEIGDVELIAYNVHLDYFGGDTRRIYQIKHFFDLWGDDRYKDNVIEILAGDFNTWLPHSLVPIYRFISILRRFFKSRGFREITADISWTQIFDRTEADHASEKGFIHISTFERLISRSDQKFKQKLDHVWVRGNVDVISCERLDFEFSDHYPIFVKLKLADINSAED